MNDSIERLSCPTEHALLDYVDHRLDPDARRRLDAHLDRCVRCQSTVAELAVGSLDDVIDLDDAPTYGGRYRVESTLGSGAMGIVFAAHDRVLDRRVAIKVLLERPEASASSTTAPGSRRAPAPHRMMLEARALARLSHPNIVEIFDVGRCPEGVFIAMELVRGTTLRRWIAERRRPWRKLLAVLLQAGDALAAAHARGIVHRDFKPDNVMIADGALKVLDFGLALHDDSVLTETGHSPGISTDPRLTRSGIVVGSPAYLAPECHHGGTAEARSDQYSFFVTLFEALCGRRPFDAASLESLVLAKLRGIDPRDVSPPSLPKWLRTAIAKGLAVDSEDRFASMEAALVALRRGQRRRWLGATVVGSSATLAVVAGLMPSRPVPACEPEARLHAVWGPSRREEVAQALRERVPDHATEILSAADAYAARWIATYAAQCRSRDEDVPQRDAVIACLGARRAALDELATMLGEADALLAAHVRARIDELPDVDTCLDVDDAPASAEERDLHEQLARANVLLTGGRFHEAGALAETLAARARAAGAGTVEAHARQLVGVAASERYDFAAADASLHEAFILAQQRGLEDVVASSAVRLAFVWGDGFGKPGIALEWARHAEAALVRAGRDPLESAELQTTLGVVLNTMGREADALPHLERTLELATNDEERATAELNVGVALARLRRPEEAAERFRRAVALRDARLGPTHALTYVARINLAGALLDAGHDDEGADVVALLVERLDEGDLPDVLRAATLSLHGDMLARRGDHEGSVRAHVQALTAIESAVGPEHPDAIRQLVNVGASYLEIGRCDEALAAAARGRVAFEAAGITDAPDYASLVQIEADARRCWAKVE